MLKIISISELRNLVHSIERYKKADHKFIATKQNRFD